MAHKWDIIKIQGSLFASRIKVIQALNKAGIKTGKIRVVPIGMNLFSAYSVEVEKHKKRMAKGVLKSIGKEWIN